MQTNDYFEQRGCLYLAKAMLHESVRAVASDPSLSRAETRHEVAWLRGLTPAAVTAQEVFETLRIPGWADTFADLVITDPVAMSKRMYGLDQLLEQIADGEACEGVAEHSMESAMDAIRERERAV